MSRGGSEMTAVWYPEVLTNNFPSVLSVRMLNLPSGSVHTPLESFFILTLTLGNGAWEIESNTIPVIVLVCPMTVPESRPATRNKMICFNLGIWLLFFRNKADFKFGNIGNFLLTPGKPGYCFGGLRGVVGV